MAKKGDSLLKQIVLWTLLICTLTVGLVVFIHQTLRIRELERQIVYKKASKLVAKERREQLRDYQKRFEQQRINQRYNQGSVVSIRTED